MPHLDFFTPQAFAGFFGYIYKFGPLFLVLILISLCLRKGPKFLARKARNIKYLIRSIIDRDKWY